MKLYATVSSERASKGQGGNEYIIIELKSGSAKNSFTEYTIEYNDYGLLVIDNCNNELLSTGGRFVGDSRKGEKQKGERVECSHCLRFVSPEEDNTCRYCGNTL